MEAAALAVVPPLIVLPIYLYSMFPGVPGGDAGELLAEACHAGTPHPPGYPSFTMAMRFAMSLRKYFGVAPATLANALCCVWGATTAYIIGLSTCTWTNSFSTENASRRTINAYCAALSSILYAFSPLVWEYSVGAEVFAMNNFLVACIVLFTVRVSVGHQENVKLNAMLGSLSCGLALSNQHTSALYIIVLVPYVGFVLLRRGLFTPSVLVKLASSFLVGLSPYLYLIFASRNVKEGSWGDMTSLAGLTKHVLRQEYGTLKVSL